MSGISGSSKLVHPNQANKGETGGEVCFFHIAIYEGLRCSINLKIDEPAPRIYRSARHFSFARSLERNENE